MVIGDNLFMKFEIMLGILFELLSKKCVTAKYLAEKYEVSVRSIYRYISSLEMAGVPLYTIRGNKGGFSIIDTYKLSSTFMTVDEFEHTISTLTAINSGIPDKILEGVILKLKASIKNEYSGFDIKGGNLIIDAGPWGDTVGYKSKLTLISQSIENSLSLSITYHDRNGEVTQRIIEPHFIVFKQGLWYVYAYCNLRKEFRFFKTGRIENATLLKTPFIKQKISKEDMPLNWHENVLAESIDFIVEKSVRADIEEWIGIENVSEIKGKIVAHAILPFDKGLVSKLMSFGNNITVLSPKKLIDEIKTNAAQILKNYK